MNETQINRMTQIIMKEQASPDLIASLLIAIQLKGAPAVINLINGMIERSAYAGTPEAKIYREAMLRILQIIPIQEVHAYRN